MKKNIIISGINLFEGGPLSVLNDCLLFLDKHFANNYNIIAFVHKKELIKSVNIQLIEVPNSRKSYLNRLYYEYVWFYFKSLKLKPYLWLSMHDVTPNVKSTIRAVYCHNPSPFYKMTFSEFKIEPSLGLFNMFYKFLYKFGINKNNYVIVQQNWIRNKFIEDLNVKKEIIVATPTLHVESTLISNKEKNPNKSPLFFYPTFARVFKNIECFCEASKELADKGYNFDVYLTINGSENKYSKYLIKKYASISNIKFIGKQSRDAVFDIYSKCDAVVFPSKLETWGLPISEAKSFKRPILLSDLPYAHETVGTYKEVSFFNPNNSSELSRLMQNIIEKKIIYQGAFANEINEPYAKDWNSLFDKILN